MQLRQPLQESLLHESWHLPKLQSHSTVPIRPNRFGIHRNSRRFFRWQIKSHMQALVECSWLLESQCDSVTTDVDGSGLKCPSILKGNESRTVNGVALVAEMLP